MQEKLTSLGSEGWELVGIYNIDNCQVVILKQPDGFLDQQ